MSSDAQSPNLKIEAQEAGTTPLIRDAIVQAAMEAGEGSLVDYLSKQAIKHPSAFLTLLGKVLPMQLTGVDGQVIKTRIEFAIVDPKQD